MATQGISLHIGLNRISVNHYGPQQELAGCENDAKDMAAIAKKMKFKSKTLLTTAAKAKPVLDYLDAAAAKLKAGDTFFITYSGHGSQVNDENGDEGEDGKDETWCLYDRMLVDDELWDRWSKFAAGVRILMLSDSCHSGTVARLLNLPARYDHITGDTARRYRYLPEASAQRAVDRHKKLYSDIQRKHRSAESASVAASVLLLSGCQDNQLSSDGDENGLFTEMLLKVYSKGSFRGGYKKFYKSILRKMPPEQTPNYYFVGVPNPVFEKQKPFTV